MLVQTAQKTVDSSCSSWLVLHQLLCNDRSRGGRQEAHVALGWKAG